MNGADEPKTLTPPSALARREAGAPRAALPARAASPRPAATPPPRIPDREQLERETEVQVFIGSGPGGQHRNKTESAVRLIHKPTGIVATATERRSQHQNKEVAFERLLAKLVIRFTPRLPRKKTKVTKGMKRRRLADKRVQSARKADRKKPGRDD